MGQSTRSVFIYVLLLTTLGIFGNSLLTPQGGKASKAEKTIWTGQSGGFMLRWSTSDITARSLSDAKEIRFSAKSLAQKNFEDQVATVKAAYGNENRLVLYERHFALLSVVGSVISFEDHYSAMLEQAVHPAGAARYTAIDLAKSSGIGYKASTEGLDIDLARPGKVSKLTDFFAESDILSGLLADPLVGNALRSSSNPAPPSTLAELIERFSSAPMVAGKCYSVSDDLLTRFAFHHLEKGKIAIRLGLSGAGPCREFLTQLGLLLPIPESLRTPLALAASGKEGFLMKDQKKIARTQKTMLKFTTDKDAEH